MKIHIENQLNDELVIAFCVGAKEYRLEPDEEITIEIEEDVCVYFDTAYRKAGTK